MRTIDLRVPPHGHAAPITHVAARPDGRRLATCSYDGTALIWDIADPAAPRPLARLRHRRLVNSSTWHPSRPDLLATASADKTVGVWRVTDEGEVHLEAVLARHTDDINSLAWLPDGVRIACVSEDGRASLWDTASGRFLAEVGAHSAHCMMVSVNAAGLVATVGEDGMIIVTDPDGTAAPAVRHYDSSIEGCAWSHAGDTLAVALDDGKVVLLSADLEPVRTIEASTSAARTVAWSADDQTLVVGSYDGSVCWFSAAGELRHRVVDERLWPRSVAVAGSVVAAGSFRDRPHLFDLASYAPLSGPTTANHGPNAMAVAAGTLHIGCDSGAVLSVDLATGASTTTEAMAGPILSLAAAEDVVYAASYAGRVVRLGPDATVDSGQLGAPVPSLCLAGGRVIAGTYNGTVIELHPETLAVLEEYQPHGGSVKSLAATATGYASAATDRTVQLGAGADRTVLWEHGNLVNAVAVLGEEVVVSASRDHTVKVGRLAADGSVLQVRTLLGPDESAKCVGVLGTPAAPVVLAGSYDFALYAWTVDWSADAAPLVSGRVLAEFDQAVSCVCAVDAETVAVASWDGTILLVGLDERGDPVVRDRFHVDELAADRAGAVSA
ncbi:WD40 repeat domain-containing protein [Actinokineospora diospyrosa]|uniref:WD40 repeat n=1 Tax=Actinokineospora diospyrosa TaxID=103728 RepID=A0ABT1IJ76_9PSEU|nr:WD40 repeat domain-containing protein [Actinokineospora diospyrosa]MCP2272707.1 WD40 repeat [Actinokineospora diospyrosa]